LLKKVKKYSPQRHTEFAEGLFKMISALNLLHALSASAISHTKPEDPCL
jgi:hypothetical protein